ncbi:hypothetical protein QWA68_016575 [Fusarium oxysporum]|nr:hypothetical protein QWA68_016575 [Fusarium oxysporum]
MAFAVPPKRFALLIGIDLYLNDGSRKSEIGGTLSLSNLQGCVNDVWGIEEFLRNEFQVDNSCVLTSPLTSSGLAMESPDRWPTFDNIKREFDTISQHASAGDLFFFHYSGHGARLQRTSKSPPGRPTDPSLMTMDFCCGKPAVRGWQLNQWLERLNAKKIRTLVILDSCHSSGAWRTSGSFRTPEGWTIVPNLPADEEAIAETAVEPGNRGGELEMSWSINPDGFTLMAACESHEAAAEKTVDGKSYGAFTHTLLACLKQNWRSEAVVTYRNLRDQVAKQVHGQTPRVFATLLIVRLERGRIYLPIGKVHGVRQRSEFATNPPSHAMFSVDQVDDFECSAPVPSALYAQTLQRHHYQIVPCRWSLGDEILQVLAHPSLGSEFQQVLRAGLRDRIVGGIEVTEPHDSHGPDSALFTVTNRGNGGVDLAGSPYLIGYEGPVRGLDLTGVNIAQLASKSAVALAHLTRFGQILSLGVNASQQLVPFELTLNPKGNRGGSSSQRSS